MVQLTPQVLELLRRPDSNKILSTINADGTPHSVVCGSFEMSDDGCIGVGKVWFRTTGENLMRDPRAEFLVWLGKYAYSIQVELSEKSRRSEDVDSINEQLDKMQMKARSVWFFTPLSVMDQGITSTTGQQIV